MSPRQPVCVAALAACALALASSAQAATFTSPTPYLSPADSPLPASGWLYNYLETWDSSSRPPPAGSYTASGGGAVGNSPAVDSVDSDDGSIDGNGNKGTSYYSGGLQYLTFTFKAGVLGTLPTSVGIAFTDVYTLLQGGTPGFDQAYFEAFDGNGVSLGSRSFDFGDGDFHGQTAEDRFIGVSDAGGIGSIKVGFANSADWEVDHLQIAAVPEPSTTVLSLMGMAALLLARRAATRGR